jgi:deazaflavin-dependent oxidoreductase (nitroreductase family)
MANLKDQAFKWLTKVHEGVFNATNGRVFGKAGGMTVVKLTTTGRKSGQKRNTMLTSPINDDERIILVASYGGDPRNPAWFLNLRDNPDVEVQVGGQKKKMKARVAPPEEKAVLWPQVTEKYKNYAGYQTKTDRDIPLVILEPA